MWSAFRSYLVAALRKVELCCRILASRLEKAQPGGVAGNVGNSGGAGDSDVASDRDGCRQPAPDGARSADVANCDAAGPIEVILFAADDGDFRQLNDIVREQARETQRHAQEGIENIFSAIGPVITEALAPLDLVHELPRLFVQSQLGLYQSLDRLVGIAAELNTGIELAKRTGVFRRLEELAAIQMSAKVD